MILKSTSSLGFNCESNSWICIIINELIGCRSDDIIQKLMCDKNLLLFDLEHLGVVKVLSNAGFFVFIWSHFPPNSDWLRLDKKFPWTWNEFWFWQVGLIHPFYLTPSHSYHASLVEQGCQSKGCAKFISKSTAIWFRR